MTEIIGLIGATLTTISFLPQAIKTLKTGDASGISFAMYVIFITGVAFWLVYGVLLKNPIIIVANIITFILSGVILHVKVKNLRNKNNEE